MIMEVIKFDFETREISRKLIAEGYTNKVYCKNYWDAHGKRHYDFKAPTQYKFDKPKKFELYRVEIEHQFKYTGTTVFEFLYLYIDGEKLDVGEITEFRELKTKINLDCCVGAG
jgi:hypothetical protein